MRSALLLGGLLVSVAACVTTDPTNETGARLPDGVTLLESGEDSCEGVVHIAEGIRGSEVVVRAGQNASFRATGDEIEWTCVGESSASEDSLECPDDTSYVRITRPAAGDDFLVECYG